MNTQYTFMLKKIGNIPDLALELTLISSNYPCLEHIFMVPKVFETLKFYCMSVIVYFALALMHSERQKMYASLVFLSAKG